MKRTMAPGEPEDGDWERGTDEPMNIDSTFSGTSNTWSSDYSRTQWSNANYSAALQQQRALGAASTVIGMGGLLRSGKDTVADYLVAQYGFVKLGMSDALADALYTLNPVLWEDTRYQDIVDKVGYVEAKTIPEVRRLLQVLGTEVGRNMISENVWADIVRSRISKLTAEGKQVVVTGIRFPNELEMIHSLSGVTWWVDRPGIESGSAHASENTITGADFDAIIRNDSTLGALYNRVEDYYDMLKAR